MSARSEARTTGSTLGPVFVSGAGAWLSTVDGRRFFDGTAGSGAVGLGHQHPVVTAAVIEQVSRLSHTGCKLGSLPRDRFSAALGALTRYRDPVVPPTATGSEAVEASLKVARAVTVSGKWRRFSQCYLARPRVPQNDR